MAPHTVRGHPDVDRPRGAVSCVGLYGALPPCALHLSLALYPACPVLVARPGPPPLLQTTPTPSMRRPWGVLSRRSSGGAVRTRRRRHPVGGSSSSKAGQEVRLVCAGPGVCLEAVACQIVHWMPPNLRPQPWAALVSRAFVLCPPCHQKGTPAAVVRSWVGRGAPGLRTLVHVHIEFPLTLLRPFPSFATPVPCASLTAHPAPARLCSASPGQQTARQ